jgi:NAD-dependent deacetylase
VTQNVDGLHGLAGSQELLEIHGSIWRVRCLGCGLEAEQRRLDLPAPPRCETCGGLLRPGVVWFGESLDPGLLERAWRAAGEAEVMLVIGTSAVVHPAASLAGVAKQAGAYVIEVNPEPTPNTGQVDASLRGRAGELLPELLPPC